MAGHSMTGQACLKISIASHLLYILLSLKSTSHHLKLYQIIYIKYNVDREDPHQLIYWPSLHKTPPCYPSQALLEMKVRTRKTSLWSTRICQFFMVCEMKNAHNSKTQHSKVQCKITLWYNAFTFIHWHWKHYNPMSPHYKCDEIGLVR